MTFTFDKNDHIVKKAMIKKIAVSTLLPLTYKFMVQSLKFSVPWHKSPKFSVP